jgi:hypothetical protein
VASKTSPVIGGPRKYLPGTESFWNEIFWNARNQCEGVITPRYRAGIATHPGARALFARRPPGIDQIILGAIQTGLPVPINPQEITSSWMRRMSFVLSRPEPGVYISPDGKRRVDNSQYADHSDRPTCQIMVIRSRRLVEVDFAERERNPIALQLTSSAAHTIRPQGFFSSRSTSSTGRFGPQPPAVNAHRNFTHMVLPPPSVGPTHGSGPPLGVFQVDGSASRETSVPSILAAERFSTPNRRERKPRESSAINDGSPVDSLSRATTVSLESPIMEEAGPQAQELPSWRGLPPPLTTRSRKRKHSGHVQAEKPSPKRQKQGAVTNGDGPTPRPPLAAASGFTSPTNSHDIDIAENTPGVIIPMPSPPNETQSRGRTPTSKKPREATKDILKPMILEVIEECGGMIPHEFLCISDYLSQKWRAKGKSGQPDKKSCMEVIKNLCTGGKIKKLAFSFQRKSGTIATKSLITSVDVDATSEAVQRLQQNIINALPDLYVPPLGSILEAPSIEAPPPEAPPSTPRADKKVSKVSGQKTIVQRFRARHGVSKDVFGASPRRKPFKWQGPSNHVPIQGPEDFLALAFHYQAANYNENGESRWTNLDIPATGKEQVRAKRKTSISRKRPDTVTRRQQNPKPPGHDRSLLENDDDKTPLNDEWQLRYACYLCDATRTTKSLARYHIRHEHSASVPDDDRIREVHVDMQGRRRGNYHGPWATQKPVSTLSVPVPEDVVAVVGETELEDATMTEAPKFGRSSRGRKIIWKNKDSDVLPPPLPSSLQDIIDMPGQIPTIDYSGSEDPDTNYFLWGLDAVEYWETTILRIYQQQTSEWTFINHTSKERSFPGLDQSSDLQWQEPDVLIIEAHRPRPSASKQKRPDPQARPRKLPVEHDEDQSVDSEFDPTFEGDVETPLPKRPRRSSTRTTRHPRDSAKEKRKPRETGEPLKRTGRPRILQNMSSVEIYRIVIAVIVVRTLTGGIGGEIDWSIVQKICPDRNETFLSDRWQTLVIKNRQDIIRLNVSLQEKYVAAFDKGEVPGINFDDIYGSDWEGIVSWAEKNLEKDSSEFDTLPSTRDELLQEKTLTFDEPQTLRDALAYTGKQYHPLKEEILTSTPAAVPILPLSNSNNTNTLALEIEAETEELDPVLSLAKSWALATIATSPSTLDAEAVTRKLSTLASTKKESDALFDKALRALQRNLVVKRNKGASGPNSKLRLQSGWRVSERWFEQFDTKRMITKAMLRAAVAWKRDVLDANLAMGNGKGVDISKTDILSDGSMVAIINLLANGRVRISPGARGLPRGRYGLDPNATNYNTKGMGRLLTLFDTVVRPVRDRYVPGDPMAARRRPIPSWDDEGNGRIPCWIDMNGMLNTEIWEMVVCAVVGLVSGRPGIGAVEIGRSLGHGMAGWEVETVLKWLEGSGFIEKTRFGAGWGTMEWWWVVCRYET